MGLTYSSVVDCPRDEVFAWHSRPGAFERLSPPWQPMRLISQAESLQDGQAVLALPGGFRWVAQHQAAGYDPPQRFVDTIGGTGFVSTMTRIALRWKHIHTFEEIDHTHTRVTDQVQTPVPGSALRPMFTYRHRQMTDDLAAHKQAAEHGLRPMTVAVTGSSGLVGSALCAFLTTGGHDVIRLVRQPTSASDERQWNPADPDPGLLVGVDAVVHLAGSAIAGRFTDAHRHAIHSSRIAPTRRLAELVARTPDGPKVFICASAIGYYGHDRADNELTEDSARGEGFLADVVTEWEEATQPAAQSDVRVVLMRTGIVQSPRGGTLRLLRPLFTAGLGGRVSDGNQWLSWIGIDDLVDAYYRALWDGALSGPVNAVAPKPVRNAEYTRTLAHVLHRPALLPVPALGPRLLLGEQGTRELACASQRVVAGKLQRAGHRFRHPDLEQALRHLLGARAADAEA